jgi:hypothetical protein
VEDGQKLPLLGAISGALRWVEELIVLVSGPMLTIGLGIGLVALLSGGKLLVDVPWLLYAWAVAQTFGADGNLVGMWYRVRLAVVRKQWVALIAYTLLGLLLGYVAFVASLVFSYQEAYGMTTTEALHRLGFNDDTWLVQRAAIGVFLVCLSAFLRYRAPVVDRRTLAEKKRALEEQMELDALKTQARAQQARGIAALVRTTVVAARGKEVEHAEGAGAMAGADARAEEVADPLRLRRQA